MAFLDETGLAELWRLVKAEDADVLADAVAGKAKIQVGTYTGTNTSGSANPNSLTFSFVPKFVAIIITADFVRSTQTRSLAMFIRPDLITSYKDQGALIADYNAGVKMGYDLFTKVAGNTLYWYYNGAGQSSRQLNDPCEYQYIAIG